MRYVSGVLPGAAVREKAEEAEIEGMCCVAEALGLTVSAYQRGLRRAARDALLQRQEDDHE